MKIISQTLSREELKGLAGNFFGDMIKAVVDVDKELIAVDAELHSDLEALLLENGSKQKDLWGINFYPGKKGDQWLEFDSMINIRPGQGNRSRGVEDQGMQKKILDIVKQRIKA